MTKIMCNDSHSYTVGLSNLTGKETFPFFLLLYMHKGGFSVL